MNNIAVKNIDRIPKKVLDLFNTKDNVFFVYDIPRKQPLIECAILPFELAVTAPCICLDMDSYWALRKTRNKNRLFNWGQPLSLDSSQKDEVVAMLMKAPALSNTETEILGVPCEKMA